MKNQSNPLPPDGVSKPDPPPCPPKFSCGGLVPQKDSDLKGVLLDRGWWKCKVCGVVFEAYTSPPVGHVCKNR